MKKANLKGIVLAVTLSVASGCALPASEPEQQNSPTAVEGLQQNPPATLTGAPSHPDPTVSFAIDKDTTVEIYDFSRGVLVMESGKAEGERPVLKAYKDLIDSRRLVDLYKKLRPDLEVPAALVELQAKLGTGVAPASTNHDPQPSEGGSSLKGDLSGVVSPNNACSNGCCDPTWLSNNICSGFSGYPYTWFLLDYGWSYANSGSIDYYYGAACAGIGTSLFTVNVGDGSGGQWSVAAGYYRSYSWLAGCYFLNCPAEKSISTSVNSQSNQHLHSYCGVFHW